VPTPARRSAILAGASEKNLESDMKTTILGRSGLQVSRIAFGRWQLGGEWGHFDEGGAVTAIRRVLAATDVSLNDKDLAGIDTIMASATPVAGPSPESV
jgi:hypothetical protein